MASKAGSKPVASAREKHLKQENDLLKATILAMQEESPHVTLPPEVEAEIAVLFADNVVSSQMTRTVARALVAQGKKSDEVIEAIRNNGVVVW